MRGKQFDLPRLSLAPYQAQRFGTTFTRFVFWCRQTDGLCPDVRLKLSEAVVLSCSEGTRVLILLPHVFVFALSYNIAPASSEGSGATKGVRF